MLARGFGPFNDKLNRSLKGHAAGVDGWIVGKPDELPVVLMHVASYGEFEGVLPLIESLNSSGKCKVAVSYSSPSAVNAVMAEEGIWASGYLPHDLVYQQLKLLARLEPSVILISKHDFWPNLIRAAKALSIPTLIINGNFHPRSKRNLPVIRSFHRAFMKHLEAVWTVSEADAERVEPLLSRATKLLVVGDTRYDRVRQRAEQGDKRFTGLRVALQPGPVFIAGSSWQPDEKICWEAFASIASDYPDARLIIVPHEPTHGALERNLSAAATHKLKVQLFSEWQNEKIDESVLLVDRMGVLADLYTAGWVTYVGGGFGAGVHSVIEPCAHGLPVAFGPNHYVSHEATLLIEAGGGFAVSTTDDLEQLWRGWLNDADSYRNAARAADGVVRSREGATAKMMELLTPYIG